MEGSGVLQYCILFSIYSKVPGHRGHPGVVAVSPVVKEVPQEPVLALLLRVIPVQEKVQIHEDVSEETVQVLLLATLPHAIHPSHL